MRKIISKVLILVLFSSCISVKKYERKINEVNVDLGYLHDSEKSNNKTARIIALEVLDVTKDTVFKTKASRNSRHFIHLILFQSYHYDYKVTLGKNSIIPDLNAFIRSSVKKESERSGDFFIVDEHQQVERRLIIEIKNFVFKSNFRKGSIAFGNMSNTTFKITPEKPSLIINAKLKDIQGNIIFEKKYISSKFSAFKGLTSSKSKEIRVELMDNLAESVSENVKNIVAEIVQDINNLE